MCETKTTPGIWAPAWRQVPLGGVCHSRLAAWATFNKWWEGISLAEGREEVMAGAGWWGAGATLGSRDLTTRRTFTSGLPSQRWTESTLMNKCICWRSNWQWWLIRILLCFLTEQSLLCFGASPPELGLRLLQGGQEDGRSYQSVSLGVLLCSNVKGAGFKVQVPKQAKPWPRDSRYFSRRLALLVWGHLAVFDYKVSRGCPAFPLFLECGTRIRSPLSRSGEARFASLWEHVLSETLHCPLLPPPRRWLLSQAAPALHPCPLWPSPEVWPTSLGRQGWSLTSWGRSVVDGYRAARWAWTLTSSCFWQVSHKPSSPVP